MRMAPQAAGWMSKTEIFIQDGLQLVASRSTDCIVKLFITIIIIYYFYYFIIIIQIRHLVT